MNQPEISPPPGPPPEPVARLGEKAAQFGLGLRASMGARPLPGEVGDRLQAWLAEGRAGEMNYLERLPREGLDLRAWKPWVRSALLFALPYRRAGGGFRGGGRVARYALGRDYHHVLGRRLGRLGRSLVALGQIGRFRAVVDAAPVLEREWALHGGVGFRGKNTLLLHPEHGPWVLLGELLLDREIPDWAAEPSRRATCGSCTRCLDACPTRAFDGAYRLDPRRCLSYLTIESSGWFPRNLRQAAGDWVFGCDVCMEVCPFGSREEDHAAEWGLHPALEATSLADLLTMPEGVFHRLFAGSPLRRSGWTGLLRNACVVLGNLGIGTDNLVQALNSHPSALVRGHAAWALGRQGAGGQALERSSRLDPDSEVRLEARLAGSQALVGGGQDAGPEETAIS